MALALAEIRDPLSVNALLSLIDVNDREVRVNVAETLGEIGSSKASAGLLKLLTISMQKCGGGSACGR